MTEEEMGHTWEREEGNGNPSVNLNPDLEDDIRPLVPFREKVIRVLHSHKFQLCVIGLVIFDCFLVLAELLIEVQNTDHHDAHLASHVLHYLSIAVLSIFLVELVVKLYAFRLEFFHHKLEMFDGVVVIVSFGMDIAFLHSSNVAVGSGSGLIILLRLWRVARILNGVVLSVKTQAEHTLSKERKLKEALEQELFQCKDTIVNLEQEVNNLRKLLKQNGIDIPENDVETKIDISDK